MTWSVVYHPAVADDLVAIGHAEARGILDVIGKRIQNGEPDKMGKAPSINQDAAGSPSSRRSIRVISASSGGDW